MDAGTVAAILGINIALGVIIWWRLEKNGMVLDSKLKEAAAEISNQSPATFENFKDDMSDLILDTISEMRPPAIADHLGGILAQWAQLKFAKQMQDMNLPTMMQAPPPDHNFEEVH
jgi:hypothetical protein